MSTATIMVYADEGTGALSLLQLIKALKQHYPQANIQRINRQSLLEGVLKRASLLIMPGGRDLVYHLELAKEGAQHIQEFVYNGGRYLGICAGGYFGSRLVRFGIGHGNVLLSARRLQFFKGEAIGPALGSAPYEFSSLEHCKVMSMIACCNHLEPLSWAYYNAGCYFEDTPTEAGPEWKPLLSYAGCSKDFKERYAAVECWPKNGYALLCGIHPEYHFSRMPTKAPHSGQLICSLRTHQGSIDKLFCQIVDRALNGTKS